MSLLNRKPRPIRREVFVARDDRCFYVASEDRYAVEQYLGFLKIPRVHIYTYPTQEGTGSSAQYVVDRLLDARGKLKKKFEIIPEDEFWVVVDTDHQIRPAHKASFVTALETALRQGLKIAVSNPSFELWLLLHHAAVVKGTTFANSGLVEEELRSRLGAYNKKKLLAENYPLASVPEAISRARALEDNPDVPEGHWPESAGSRFYLLIEQIFRAGTRTSSARIDTL